MLDAEFAFYLYI